MAEQPKDIKNGKLPLSVATDTPPSWRSDPPDLSGFGSAAPIDVGDQRYNYVPASPTYPPNSPPYHCSSPTYAATSAGPSTSWVPPISLEPTPWPFLGNAPPFKGGGGRGGQRGGSSDGQGTRRGRARRSGKPRPVDRRPPPGPRPAPTRAPVIGPNAVGNQNLAALRVAVQQAAPVGNPVQNVVAQAAPQQALAAQAPPAQVLQQAPGAGVGPNGVPNRAMSTYDLQLDDELPPLQVDVLPCVLRPITGGTLPCHGASCRPCVSDYMKTIGADPALLTNCSPGEQATCVRCNLLGEAVRTGALFNPVRHHYARASVLAWKREAKFLASREVVYNKRTVHTPRQVFLAVERKLKQMGCGEELSTYLATEAASRSIELSATEWLMLDKLESGQMSDVVLRQRNWYDGTGSNRVKAVGHAAMVAAPVATVMAAARLPKIGVPALVVAGIASYITGFNPFRWVSEHAVQAANNWSGVESLPNH
jgi:hypothetical protein